MVPGGRYQIGNGAGSSAMDPLAERERVISTGVVWMALTCIGRSPIQSGRVEAPFNKLGDERYHRVDRAGSRRRAISS